MTLVVFRNHDFCSADQAVIAAGDPGYAFGEGVFETIRAYRGRPFQLTEHLARMTHGLKLLEISQPPAFADFPDLITRLLESNHLLSVDAVIRITVSPGSGNHPEANLIITAAPLDEAEITRRQKGLRAAFAPWQRDCRNPLLTVKSLNYLENRLALRRARARGFDEAVFCNQYGAICEGSFSSLFLIQQDKLITPALSCGLLAGTTREFIIRHAQNLGLSCRECEIYPDDLEQADGALLCSSLMEAVPLLSLGDRSFSLTAGPDLAARIRRTLQEARNS